MEQAPEPSMQLLAEAAQTQSPLPDLHVPQTLDHDDRSSSLSDIDDRPMTEGTDGPPDKSSELSEEDDTEAETERLEESPDKTRKSKQVLLTANEGISNNTPSPGGKMEDVELDGDENIGADAPSRDDLQSDLMDHTSPISSLDDSGDEGSIAESITSSSSRKRKIGSEDATNKSLKQAAMQLLANQVGDDAEDVKDTAHFIVTSASGREVLENGELFEEHSEASPQEPQLDDDVENGEVDHDEAAESNDEDVDMEDVGAEAEASARNEEEVARKKSALDLLGKIENDFALLRDKLFAERTKQLNEELASLESNNTSHAEYLSMLSAIEAQRQERVALARTAFRFKIKALQTKSVAERTVHHSQYMQSVREIRDSSLERANHEWYQMHRSRRALEEPPVERILLTSYKRSDLVSQQNSYNTEVSILSGMAKYVGFPAAPEIRGISQSEMDEDLRMMGISLQPQPSHVSSSINQILRQNLAAEKQFTKNTPWANAQHPQHTHNPNGPHLWNSTQSDIPLTPATQSNIIDAHPTNNSTSTIAIPSSEIVTSHPRPMSRVVSEQFGETPSRMPPLIMQDAPIGLTVSEDLPLDKNPNEQTHIFSSPMARTTLHSISQDQPPRSLKSPGNASDSTLTSGFGRHGKMPAEVKVGMA